MAAACVALLLVLNVARAWRSELYPVDWDPETAGAEGFATGRFLADFSYAGYRMGEEPIPNVTGPVFNVTSAPYNADPTGTNDATTAIRNAIGAASAAGGGVVYLPAGTYRISVGTGFTEAFLITTPNVVIRGAGTDKTFIVNTTTSMREKSVFRFSGPNDAGYFASAASGTLLREDVLAPTKRIRLANVTGFAAGNLVIVRHDVTEAWIAEHNETSWTGLASQIRGASYLRQVVSVDTADRALILDAPVYYYLKTRDNARVRRINSAPLTGVGIEDLSLGNMPHTGSGFGEDDYNRSGTAGYQVHSCFLIRFERVRDGWIRRVSTHRPVGSPSTAHHLSGGVSLNECTRVTVQDCDFQRPLYGGGGGNGYQYRMQSSGLCLIERCRATFSRHGFMFSHMSTAGSVLRYCVDTTTGRAVGASGVNGYATSGKGSDHHMHLSHANLIDACVADDSWYEARYRGTSGTVPHALSSAHTAFWNIEGRGTVSNAVVTTEQARYGYVIGTRGNRNTVSRPGVARSKTDPLDHVEGVGQGATLEPFSLSEDQLIRRLRRPTVKVPETVRVPFPAKTVRIQASDPRLAAQPVAWPVLSPTWGSTSPGVTLAPEADGAVLVTVPGPGTWPVTLTVSAEGRTLVSTVTVVATGPDPSGMMVVPVGGDAGIRGGTFGNDNMGGDARMDVKEDTNDSYDRRSVAWFDLTSLAGKTVLGATLVVNTVGYPADAANWVVGLHPVAATWEESTVTWNNVPAFGPAILTYTPSPTRQERLDVTEALAAAVTAGDARFSVGWAVQSQTGTSVLGYHTRESASGGPWLEVAYARPELGVETWVAEKKPSVPANLRGPLDDPDGDGVPNLWEMVIGRDPGMADAGPMLTLDPVESLLLFTLADPLPAGLQLVLETSVDLVNWASMTIAAEWVTELPNRTRQLRVPIASAENPSFWRLRASLE